jgi:hypothetical protein
MKSEKINYSGVGAKELAALVIWSIAHYVSRLFKRS